jgi:hypothetical protein
VDECGRLNGISIFLFVSACAKLVATYSIDSISPLVAYVSPSHGRETHIFMSHTFPVLQSRYENARILPVSAPEVIIPPESIANTVVPVNVYSRAIDAF